jgi:hypothetical protein
MSIGVPMPPRFFADGNYTALRFLDGAMAYMGR